MRSSDRSARTLGRPLRAAGAALLTLALASCTIVHVYKGARLRADPSQIVAGQTTMGDVLQLFGAPTNIQRRPGGDVFVYTYLRRDVRELEIEEGFVTNIEILTYTTINEKSDRLVVLFDRDGVVVERGYAFDTLEIDEPESRPDE